MAFRSLLDKQCMIIRLTPVVDNLKTPRGQNRETFGPYPCALSRKVLQATQDAPQNKVAEAYTLYLTKYANVKAGDLAEIEGTGKYRLGPPYRPRNHHVEVLAEWEGEA